MKHFCSLTILLLLTYCSTAQQLFLKLVTPNKNQTVVTAAKQYITGTTCKECTVQLNEQPVKVWPTGAFAAELNLAPGDTSVQLTATDTKGNKTTQKLFFSYKLPVKETAVTGKTVAYWRIEPAGNLYVKPGDRLRMTVKTMPGAVVKLENGFELKEIPVKDSTGVAGIYKGEYIVAEEDELFTNDPKILKLTVQLNEQDQIEATTRNKYAMMQPVLLETQGLLPYLLVGLGEDRLGGTKIGYLDSLVKLYAVSKAGDKYCVRLSKYRQAYIEEEYVRVVPTPAVAPSVITGNMRVWGDSINDYVSLQVGERLPYQTFQLVNPSRIVVDVFGATANTNWITQLSSATEIKNVTYEQTEDDVFRITIELNHQQHWGHAVSYSGNTLLIKVKHQPRSLLLRDLVIGVDAGHGGDNKGAFGITGVMEKNMTLLLARLLKQVLEEEGATVIMSRTKDTSYDNHDRYSFFKAMNPDLLISVHLNSSADPIRTKGVSTYYKHIGYRSLTTSVLKQMTGMGLAEYGNVGHFNFLLNGFTEFPNVLVETLFISNPEDEANVLNPDYRMKLVQAIKEGIKAWLTEILQMK
ncbi:MAG: N-acetylmuramoyl-L-alanine amidase [Chitinophagaceae bacterium]